MKRDFLPFPFYSIPKEATTPSESALLDPLRDGNGLPSAFAAVTPGGQPVEELQKLEWGCSHTGYRRSHRWIDVGMGIH